MKNAKRIPVDLDSVMNELDFDNDNSTSNISSPEEARVETQKVVHLLEQLLLSSDDNDDDYDDSVQTTAATHAVRTIKTIVNQGVDEQVQQPGTSSHDVTATAIATTVAPTKAPMSPKQIKRATVRHPYLSA